MVELEDVVVRRDYKLKPKFHQWCHCGSLNWLYMVDGTIKMRCASNSHVTSISRYCTHCNKECDFHSHSCPNCEPDIINITQLEITIEECNKGLRKLQKNFKAKRILEPAYLDMKDEYETEIKRCEENLLKVKESRIGQSLESPIKQL